MTSREQGSPALRPTRAGRLRATEVPIGPQVLRGRGASISQCPAEQVSTPWPHRAPGGSSYTRGLQQDPRLCGQSCPPGKGLRWGATAALGPWRGRGQPRSENRGWGAGDAGWRSGPGGLWAECLGGGEWRTAGPLAGPLAGVLGGCGHLAEKGELSRGLTGKAVWRGCCGLGGWGLGGRSA